MSRQDDKRINRRNFLKTAGLMGVGSVIAAAKANAADANEPNARRRSHQFKKCRNENSAKRALKSRCCRLVSAGPASRRF